MLTKVYCRVYYRAHMFFWLIKNGFWPAKMALKCHGWLMQDWSREMQRRHFFVFLSYGWLIEHNKGSIY